MPTRLRSLLRSCCGSNGTQPFTESGLPPSMDEQTRIDFEKYPDFASKITRLWEEETHLARSSGVRVINCRFATVLGQKGSLSSEIMPGELQFIDYFLC